MQFLCFERKLHEVFREAELQALLTTRVHSSWLRQPTGRTRLAFSISNNWSWMNSNINAMLICKNNENHIGKRGTVPDKLLRWCPTASKQRNKFSETFFREKNCLSKCTHCMTRYLLPLHSVVHHCAHQR